MKQVPWEDTEKACYLQTPIGTYFITGSDNLYTGERRVGLDTDKLFYQLNVSLDEAKRSCLFHFTNRCVELKNYIEEIGLQI